MCSIPIANSSHGTAVGRIGTVHLAAGYSTDTCGEGSPFPGWDGQTLSCTRSRANASIPSRTEIQMMGSRG